jgi:hypothetical protein
MSEAVIKLEIYTNNKDGVIRWYRDGILQKCCRTDTDRDCNGECPFLYLTLPGNYGQRPGIHIQCAGNGLWHPSDGNSSYVSVKIHKEGE